MYLLADCQSDHCAHEPLSPGSPISNPKGPLIRNRNLLKKKNKNITNAVYACSVCKCCLVNYFVTHAYIVLGEGRLSALNVCMCVCQHCKNTGRKCITKRGRWIVHDMSWLSILFEVKRSSVNVGVSLYLSECQSSRFLLSSGFVFNSVGSLCGRPVRRIACLARSFLHPFVCPSCPYTCS